MGGILMKKLSTYALIIVVLALAFGSFAPSVRAQSAPTTETLYVGPQLDECPADTGEIVLCYQVRYNPNDKWSLYNGEIVGLDYQIGYNYELIVQETQGQIPGTETFKPYWVVQTVVSAEPARPPQYKLPAEVYNVQWQMANYTVGTGVNDVAGAGVVSTIVFDPSGAFWGNAGCNDYSGFYDLPEENAIKLRDIVTTRMACSTAQNDVEQSVLGAFNSVSTYIYTATSSLTLNFDLGPGTLNYNHAPTTTVQTSAAPETLPDSAENTDWTLTSYDTGVSGAQYNALSDLLAPAGAPVDVRALRVKALANFAGNGRVLGFSGCNFYRASYRTGPNDSLSLANVITTRRACSGAADMVEQTYLAALEVVSGYKLDGKNLIINFNNGRGTLTFSLGAATLPGNVQAGMPRTGTPHDSSIPILPLALLALALAASGLSLKLLRNNA
jgi:heat shock protein HslJ